MYNQVSYPKTVEAKERGFQALNKHFKLLGVLLLAMVLLAIPFAVQADAAEGQSVVYLMDGATGDGSSPESPTKSINTAFAALDNSLDCTVVVCGPFTHVANNYFVRQNWPKSVTITSVYGGVDYRETRSTTPRAASASIAAAQPRLRTSRSRTRRQRTSSSSWSALIIRLRSVRAL